MQHNLIFLIGFMGVGKSTLGKKTAHHLGLKFIDTDKKIEKKWNLSIRSIFEKHGENFFRNEETKLLKEIIEKTENAIISVGGGLPCFNKNMEIMNKFGTTCYLYQPPKELFKRLIKDKEDRPLICSFNDEQLLNFIEQKLGEREVYYNRADFVISKEQQEVKQLIEILGLESLE